MSKVSFKQRDVQALIRAAKAEGHLNPVVDKRPDGTLRLLTEAPAEPVASSDEAENFWDRRRDGQGRA